MKPQAQHQFRKCSVHEGEFQTLRTQLVPRSERRLRSLRADGPFLIGKLEASACFLLLISLASSNLSHRPVASLLLLPEGQTRKSMDHVLVPVFQAVTRRKTSHVR